MKKHFTGTPPNHRDPHESGENDLQKKSPTSNGGQVFKHFKKPFALTYTLEL